MVIDDDIIAANIYGLNTLHTLSQQINSSGVGPTSLQVVKVKSHKHRDVKRFPSGHTTTKYRFRIWIKTIWIQILTLLTAKPYSVIQCIK